MTSFALQLVQGVAEAFEEPFQFIHQVNKDALTSVDDSHQRAVEAALVHMTVTYPAFRCDQVSAVRTWLKERVLEPWVQLEVFVVYPPTKRMRYGYVISLDGTRVEVGSTAKL